MKINWLRWFLLVPGAWFAWHVAVLIGFAVHSALETLCPAEQMVSDMCVAPWFHYAARASICLGAGLAATLILLTTTLLAPSRRSAVVVVTLAAGSAAALAMGVLAKAYLELATTLMVGGLTAICLLKCDWVRSSNKNIQPTGHSGG